MRLCLSLENIFAMAMQIVKLNIFSLTIRRIMRAILVTPASVSPLVEVFVQASIYPFNLHMPRPIFFSLGMDIHHSKLVMPREFGVTRSKFKVIVTFLYRNI